MSGDFLRGQVIETRALRQHRSLKSLYDSLYTANSLSQAVTTILADDERSTTAQIYSINGHAVNANPSYEPPTCPGLMLGLRLSWYSSQFKNVIHDMYQKDRSAPPNHQQSIPRPYVYTQRRPDPSRVMMSRTQTAADWRAALTCVGFLLVSRLGSSISIPRQN